MAEPPICNASNRGWGVSCEGICTGGPWPPGEKMWYINCLEALAAFHAVKCFVRDMQKEPYHPSQDGQHYCSGLCIQSGWDGVPQAELHSQRTLVVHEQGYYPGDRTPSRGTMAD